MKTRYKYLEDTSFLKKLTLQRVKTYLVKITVLNWNESPISSIEGRVISASINIDGQSPIRRTANLSIFIDELTNNITNSENILSINKKISIEIGYINETNEYPEYDILWFPLGTYIIISCSISHSDTGLVASLQLQDKMCLLDGSVGGVIPAATQFHIRDQANGETVKVPIYQIIQELVNHWGGEQLGKILISDLDTIVPYGMRWTLKNPLYKIQQSEHNVSFFATKQQAEAARDLINKEKSEEEKIEIIEIPYGQDVGFINSVFCYPDELVCDTGASVTQMLEKIIQVLGNYEYFYDLDGNFRFQEKKNYLNNSQAKYILDSANRENITDFLPDYIAQRENGLLNAYLMDMSKGASVFDFEDSNMIKSYTNTPQYGAIKNDFLIWGIRTDIEKREWPIRYHLAIDRKPVISSTPYFAFEKKEVLYVSNGQDVLSQTGVWVLPIIILQQGSTKKYPHNPISSELDLPQASYNTLNRYYYKEIDNSVYETYQKDDESYEWRKLDDVPIDIKVDDWRTQLLMDGAAAQALGLTPNPYYIELKNEWPKIYNVAAGKFYPQALEKPYQIDYYLDFIDAGNSPISQFSVDNIGRRSYVVDNGKNTNCIFENVIPNIFLIKNGQEDTASLQEQCTNKGQDWTLVSAEIYDNLEVGGIYNSAYQEIRQTIHTFTSYNETITLQTLPIYFLQPNTRISVFSPQSNIYGDYMIDSMSFSLENESLLTINASRALQKV